MAEKPPAYGVLSPRPEGLRRGKGGSGLRGEVDESKIYHVGVAALYLTLHTGWVVPTVILRGRHHGPQMQIRRLSLRKSHSCLEESQSGLDTGLSDPKADILLRASVCCLPSSLSTLSSRLSYPC